MIKKTTRNEQYSKSNSVLYLAFELSNLDWKLAFSIGMGQKARRRTIRARDLRQLATEIALAKKRFGLREAAQVISCYEAGRDGFWLARHLTKSGIQNLVVDSSSIEVNRRARRAKADGLDVENLLKLLIRYHNGEPKVWSIVRVPSVEDEDRRQLHRELLALKKEITRTTNCIKGLLASQGIRVDCRMELLPRKLEAIQLWDHSPLPPALKSRLQRACEHVFFLRKQVKLLESMRQHEIRHSEQKDIGQVRQLCTLRAIGPQRGWLLVREFFGWRQFKNRRQVGSLSGLTPTPYQSGTTSREQGISKAGNRYVRGGAIQLGWSWLRWQPESKLTQWYLNRFANGGSRARKVGIVALSRRLLIDLWRFLETGVIPEGALLKAEV